MPRSFLAFCLGELAVLRELVLAVESTTLGKYCLINSDSSFSF